MQTCTDASRQGKALSTWNYDRVWDCNPHAARRPTSIPPRDLESSYGETELTGISGREILEFLVSEEHRFLFSQLRTLFYQNSEALNASDALVELLSNDLEERHRPMVQTTPSNIFRSSDCRVLVETQSMNLDELVEHRGYGPDPASIITDIVVFTKNGYDYQATTVDDYLRNVWPKPVPTFLVAIQDALCHRNVWRGSHSKAISASKRQH